MIEMIEQIHAFPIKRESVRRMFRAKPSMLASVGQLLVDLSRVQFSCKEIVDRNQKIFCELIMNIRLITKMNHFNFRRLSKTLQVAE